MDITLPDKSQQFLVVCPGLPPTQMGQKSASENLTYAQVQLQLQNKPRNMAVAKQKGADILPPSAVVLLLLLLVVEEDSR